LWIRSTEKRADGLEALMGSEVGTIFLGLDFGASSNSETVTGWWIRTFFPYIGNNTPN
jgi:hypothetical protein